MGSPSLCRFHDDCPLSELHRNTRILSGALAGGQDIHIGASGLQAALLCLLHLIFSGLTDLGSLRDLAPLRHFLGVCFSHALRCGDARHLNPLLPCNIMRKRQMPGRTQRHKALPGSGMPAT